MKESQSATLSKTNSIANSSKIRAVDFFDNLRKCINNTCAKIFEKINYRNEAARSYINNFLSQEYHSLVLWSPAFLVAGIVFYEEFRVSSYWIFFSVALSTASAILFKLRKTLPFLFLTICLSFWSLGMLRMFLDLRLSSEVAIMNLHDVLLTGKIYNIKPASKGAANIYLDVEFIDSLEVQNIHENHLTKIQIRTPYKYLNNIMVGDSVLAELDSLQTPNYKVFPDGYDAAKQARYQGIKAMGNTFRSIIKINSEERQGFFDYIHKVRKNIYSKLISDMGKRAGNVAAAIILGEQKGIAPEILQSMRFAGISHILCVSGLHLSLVAMLSFTVIRFFLNLSDFIAFNIDVKKLAGFLALICSFLYWCLSGMQIAATRAFIMTGFVMTGVIFNRVPDPMRSIGFAVIAMLLISPTDLFHPSFLLSFTAVLSLISGYELYIKYKVYFGYGAGIFHRLKLYLLSNIYTSILASLATAPIVIYYFFFFSNYTILANLIAVPMMSFIIMPLSLLSMLLMFFGLEHRVLDLLRISINVIIALAEKVTKLPYSLWHVGSISKYGLLTFMFGFIWLVIWKSKYRIFGILIILSSVFIMLNKTKPDFMIDSRNGLIGVNDQGRLHVYTIQKKANKKLTEHWRRWFGQEEAISRTQHENISFVTKSGLSVFFIINSFECRGDVVLNFINEDKCSQKTITNPEIEKLDKFFIFCDQNACEVRLN